MTDLTVSDVEVWGFNGQATTGCGYSLPILRDKVRDRYGLYSVTHPGGPWWSSRAEIEEQVHLGRVSPLQTPLKFPESPNPSPEQSVVTWVDEAFLSELDGTGLPIMQAGWVPQSARDTRPGQLWVCCMPTVAATQLLDDCAREFVRQFDERLVAENPAWAEVERLADLGLCAAHDPATRYQLFKRYCAAMYYRPGGNPERTNQVFRLLVRNEFKTLTWERFCGDMAVVVNRSREVLHFRRATVPIAGRRNAGEAHRQSVSNWDTEESVEYSQVTHTYRAGTAGRSTSPDSETSYGYDVLGGRTTPNWDGRQQITTTVYDAAERVLPESGPLGYITTFTYDSSDRLTSEASPTRQDVYAYDPAGLAVRSPGSVDLVVLGLPAQLIERLEAEGIETVSDLITRTDSQLIHSHKFDKATVDEMRAKLLMRGMSLKSGLRPPETGPDE